MRDKDYQALSQFRYAIRKFLRFSEFESSKAGLSMQQYQVLLTIRAFPDKEEITITELAEWLQIRHHSAVGLVDRLESRGLLVRKRGRVDKREVCLRLTAKGKRILERLAVMNKQELKRLKPQIKQLASLLG
jgi:DNA-binding MarR family transcriptional regulator